MTKKTLFLLIFFIMGFYAFGQKAPEINIPMLNDKYTEFVRQLEAGKTDIDYRKFRESFIESKQFLIASHKSTELRTLEKEMYVQMHNSNYQEIISITKAMLSIDYTNMLAHKILRQTYKIVGDTLNAKKYKTIELGLLFSIKDSGDGKTCETAWHVIQISEEYFILQMQGDKLLEQSVYNSGGLCDKMIVKTEEGDKKTYYFETSKVFEGYNKLGMK
jgi:hypothetical protein